MGAIGRAQQRRGEIGGHDCHVDEAEQRGEPVLPGAAVEDARVGRFRLKEGKGVALLHPLNAEGQGLARQGGIVSVDEDHPDACGKERSDAPGLHVEPRVRGGHHAAPGVLDDAGDRGPAAVRGGGRVDEAHARLRQVGAQELGRGAHPEGAEQDGPGLAGSTRARF